VWKIPIGKTLRHINQNKSMKKLILFLFALLTAGVIVGQTTFKYNVTIQKTSPTLHLNGTGAVLNFYNGDITLTQSSNLLTLGGGNFALGSNSLSGTGSIGSTGAGKFLKGWFTDLEITNYPTINGTSLSSIFVPLTRTINSQALSSNITLTAANVGAEPALGNPGTSGYVLSSATDGTRSWIAPGTGGGGGDMTYPGAGIALSTGSAWGTSITNNSANWNTAFGWGNHGAAGYALLSGAPFTGTITPSANDGAALGTTSLKWSDLFLASGAVINFNSGNVTLTHSTGTLTLGGGNLALGSNSITMTGSLGATGAGKLTKGWFTDIEITNPPSINGTAITSTAAEINALHGIPSGLTATELGYVDGVTSGIQAQLNDTISGPTVLLELADSVGSGPGTYTSGKDFVVGLATKEASLGNPGTTGYVLSSTTGGARSWIANGAGSMVYPGAGVAISTGSAWGTSSTSTAAELNILDGATLSTTELNYVDGVTSAIQTQIDAKAPLNITLNDQTASYTLVITDAYKLVTVSNASANTVTVPPNSSVAFPTGTQITVTSIGTGQTSIVAGSGVTINSADSALKLRVRYSSCTLVKTGTNTWLLIGDIAV
jgi:hypothetical protein